MRFLSRLFSAALAALFLSPCLTAAQRPKTAVAGFTETTRDTRTTVVRGTVYCESSGTVTFKVDKPHRQWIRITPKATLVYYPDRDLAYSFRESNPAVSRLSQPFLNDMGSDLGLSKAGFTLSRKEVKDGTLLMYWKPPEQLRKVMGNVVVGMTDDKLTLVRALDVKGREIVKTTYSGYVRHKSLSFPLRMETVTHVKGASITRTTVLNDPKFDVALPKEVASFKLPPGVVPKEMGR